MEVSNIPKRKVPIAMFVGDKDILAYEEDCELLRDILGPETVIKYKVLQDFDHSSFNFYKKERIGFTDEIMELINQYNPIPVKEEVDEEADLNDFDK